MDCPYEKCRGGEISLAIGDIPPKTNMTNFESYKNCLPTDSSVDFSFDVEKPLIMKNSLQKSHISYNNIQKDMDSQALYFDELLKDLNFKIVYNNFNKLLQFLESRSNEECFPFLSDRFEEIFKHIAWDVKVLKSKSLDASLREICNKIIDAVNLNKSVYYLSCVFEKRKVYKSEPSCRVLVLQKIHGMRKEPAGILLSSVNSSMESLAASQSSSSGDPGDSSEILERSNIPDSITTDFKLHCLRTTLAFVKNNLLEKIEYPDLNLKQTKFLKHLLNCVLVYADFDSSFVNKLLYTALWETVRIYRPKYEFRIKSLESRDEKKSLVFEKIPKMEPTMDSNQVNLQRTQFLKPELPKPKKITKRQQKIMNEIDNFVTSLPRSFVLDSLNIIIDFLSEENSGSIVFLPKNENELRFYRKAIDWSRMGGNRPVQDEEYGQLFDEIKNLLVSIRCKVPKGKKSKRNEYTGIKEVVYKKKPRLTDMSSAQSSVSKKKMRQVVNNNSDGSTERSASSTRSKRKKSKITESQYSSVKCKSKSDRITRSQSKKMKCDEQESLNSDRSTERSASLIRSKTMGISFKPASQIASNTDDSDSDLSSSDEGPSHKKTKSKKTTEEVIQDIRVSIAEREKRELRERGRFRVYGRRKEELIEAMSVPVQSDKAVRMMRGMGWSGGALGAKGNGITEPIMPALHMMTGAGLGHIRGTKGRSSRLTDTNSNLSNSWKSVSNSKSNNNWKSASTSKASNERSEGTPKADNSSQASSSWRSDTNSKPSKERISESSSKVNKNSKDSNDQISKCKSKVGNNWLTDNSKFDNNWTSEYDSKLENPTQKSEPDIIVEKTKELLRANYSLENLMKNNLKKIKPNVMKAQYFKEDILNGVLELLTSDSSSKTMKFDTPLIKRERSFIKHALRILGERSKRTLTDIGQGLVEKVLEQYSKLPGVVVTACIAGNFREVVLTKQQIFSNDQMKQLNFSQIGIDTNNLDKIINENALSFVDALAPICHSKKAHSDLKFRVLILLKILFYVKSTDEELEVEFNRVLSPKQKGYIESTVEAVNTRIRFGSTPAESALSLEIKKNIGQYFLGIMFNHQYTSFTLIKYSHKKQSKNSNKNVKRRMSTTINLDNYVTDSSNEGEVSNKTGDENKNNEDVYKENVKTAESKKENVVNIKDSEVIKKIDVVSLEEEITINDNWYIKSIENNEPPNNSEVVDKGCKIIDKEHSVLVDDNDNQIITCTQDKIKRNAKVIAHRDCLIKRNEAVPNQKVTANYEILTDYQETIIGDKVNIDDKNKIIDTTEMAIDDTEKTIQNIELIDDKKAITDNQEITIEDTGKVIQNTGSFDYKEKDSNNKIKDIDNKQTIVDITEMVIDDIEKNSQNQENVNNNTNTSMCDKDVILINETSCKVASFSEIVNTDKFEIEEDESTPEKNTESESVTISINEPMEVINKEDESVKEIGSGDISMSEDNKTDVIDDDDEIMVETEANFVTETDHDSFLSKNLDLSNECCDNKLFVSVKQSVLNEEEQKDLIKETRVDTQHLKLEEIKLLKNIEITNLYLVPNDYPNTKIDEEQAKEIQKVISMNIVKSKELPLLMCHGVQKGALIYTCHNKKTFDWLQNTISVVSDLKIFSKDIRKMFLKIKCLFDLDVKYLFSMIELYNKGLSTKDWVVEGAEIKSDCVLFSVKMDKYSVNFIQSSDLAVYAGVDKVEFSPIWD